MNTLGTIREKLRQYREPVMEKKLLEKILTKFGGNYTISQLTNIGVISPLKRGKLYFNLQSNDFINPFMVGALYMQDELYTYGGLGVYNRYGFTEQIAEWYTIYNTKISGKKIIGNTKIIFKRQRKEFFYGVKTQADKNTSYNIMTPERAFIQRLKEGFVFEDIPAAVDSKKLKKMGTKYGTKKLQSQIDSLCT